MGVTTAISKTTNGLMPTIATASALASVREEMADLEETLIAIDRARRDLNDDALIMARGNPIELRRLMMGNVEAMFNARDRLSTIVRPREINCVDAPRAVEMLSVLFGALSKKTDNAQMLLLACAQQFDPVIGRIGKTTKLWKPVPSHPVVLAIAIEELLSSSVFTPMPTEVRAACVRAHAKLEVALFDVRRWVDLFVANESRLLESDPANWRAGFQETAWTVRWDSLEWMQSRLGSNKSLQKLVDAEFLALNDEPSGDDWSRKRERAGRNRLCRRIGSTPAFEEQSK